MKQRKKKINKPSWGEGRQGEMSGRWKGEGGEHSNPKQKKQNWKIKKKFFNQYVFQTHTKKRKKIRKMHILTPSPSKKKGKKDKLIYIPKFS